MKTILIILGIILLIGVLFVGFLNWIFSYLKDWE